MENYKTAEIQVPDDRSILSILNGHNAVLDGGHYLKDGWIWVGGEKVQKWFITIDGIKVWEPRLKDLASLYHIYKKAHTANAKQWAKVSAITKELWDLREGEATEAIAHAHKSKGKGTYSWWEYHISDFFGSGRHAFHVDGLDSEPENIVNRELGEALFKESEYALGSLRRRFGTIQTVFYKAMQRSLPEATEHKVICLKFDQDTFWFQSCQRGLVFVWHMFDNRYQFEIRDILNP